MDDKVPVKTAKITSLENLYIYSILQIRQSIKENNYTVGCNSEISRLYHVDTSTWYTLCSTTIAIGYEIRERS